MYVKPFVEKCTKLSFIRCTCFKVYNLKKYAKTVHYDILGWDKNLKPKSLAWDQPVEKNDYVIEMHMPIEHFRVILKYMSFMGAVYLLYTNKHTCDNVAYFKLSEQIRQTEGL